MFSSRSRYFKQPVDAVALGDGRLVQVVRFPVRKSPTVLGYHRRAAEERLDLIAYRYLQDPTAYWRLCDANESMSPGALEARDLIAIPEEGR